MIPKFTLEKPQFEISSSKILSSANAYQISFAKFQNSTWDNISAQRTSLDLFPFIPLEGIKFNKSDRIGKSLVQSDDSLRSQSSFSPFIKTPVDFQLELSRLPELNTFFHSSGNRYDGSFPQIWFSFNVSKLEIFMMLWFCRDLARGLHHIFDRSI